MNKKLLIWDTTNISYQYFDNIFFYLQKIYKIKKLEIIDFYFIYKNISEPNQEFLLFLDNLKKLNINITLINKNEKIKDKVLEISKNKLINEDYKKYKEFILIGNSGNYELLLQNIIKNNLNCYLFGNMNNNNLNKNLLEIENLNLINIDNQDNFYYLNNQIKFFYQNDLKRRENLIIWDIDNISYSYAKKTNLINYLKELPDNKIYRKLIVYGKTLQLTPEEKRELKNLNWGFIKSTFTKIEKNDQSSDLKIIEIINKEINNNIFKKLFIISNDSDFKKVINTSLNSNKNVSILCNNKNSSFKELEFLHKEENFKILEFNEIIKEEIITSKKEVNTNLENIFYQRINNLLKENINENEIISLLSLSDKNIKEFIIKKLS